MSNLNPPAQAGDETAALAKQLATWRAEVARLNDLIAHASGVQAGDEPMRAEVILEIWRDCGHADNDGNAVKFARAIIAGQVSPRATADVERERLLVDALRNIANYRADIGPQITAQSMRFYAAQALMDFATTKPGA